MYDAHCSPCWQGYSISSELIMLVSAAWAVSVCRVLNQDWARVPLGVKMKWGKQHVTHSDSVLSAAGYDRMSVSPWWLLQDVCFPHDGWQDVCFPMMAMTGCLFPADGCDRMSVSLWWLWQDVCSPMMAMTGCLFLRDGYDRMSVSPWWLRQDVCFPMMAMTGCLFPMMAMTGCLFSPWWLWQDVCLPMMAMTGCLFPHDGYDRMSVFQ